MKRIARIEMNDNTIAHIAIKKDARDFVDKNGNRYNVGSWRIRRALLGPVQEATYFEGMPNAVNVRSVEIPLAGKNGAVTVARAQLAHPEDFTGVDYEKLHGDPVVRWLTRALQNAQGGLLLQYAQLVISGVTMLAACWLAWHYYQHPWR